MMKPVFSSVLSFRETLRFSQLQQRYIPTRARLAQILTLAGAAAGLFQVARRVLK